MYRLGYELFGPPVARREDYREKTTRGVGKISAPMNERGRKRLPTKGEDRMGGRKRVFGDPPGQGIVKVSPCGYRVGKDSHGVKETTGALSERSRYMGGVVTKMVEKVIGRHIVLHDLLGPDDFASLYSGKGTGRPLWRYRHDRGVPFRATLLRFDLDFKKKHMTVLSTGYLELVPGRKIPLLMELTVERIGVSLQSVVMRGGEKTTPLTFHFDSGPDVFSEIAFSFDIGEGNRPYGISGCGFLAFPDRTL